MERHKRTPLHAAADNDRANILAILIQNGVNVNEVDEKNNNGMYADKFCVCHSSWVVK